MAKLVCEHLVPPGTVVNLIEGEGVDERVCRTQGANFGCRQQGEWRLPQGPLATKGTLRGWGDCRLMRNGSCDVSGATPQLVKE